MKPSICPACPKVQNGIFARHSICLERWMNPDRLCKLTTATMSSFQAKLRADGKLKETSMAGILRHLKGGFTMGRAAGDD